MKASEPRHTPRSIDPLNPSNRRRLFSLAAIAFGTGALAVASVGCKGNDAKTNDGDEKAASKTAAGKTTLPSDNAKTRAVPKNIEPTPPTSLPSDDREHRGEHRWSISLGGTERDSARSVAFDKKGNIFWGGVITGKVTIGDTEMVADSNDAVIVKLDPNGKPVWARHFGGPGSDMIESIAIDKDDNVIVGGSFADELVIGESRLESAGADDGFVAKFAPDSRLVWAKRVGGMSVDTVSGVAVDGSGNVYASSNFRLDLKLEETRHKTEGIDDALLIALAPDGKLRWTRTLAGPGIEYGRAVATDAKGAIFWTAEFSRTAKVGETTLESTGNRDVAIIKLDGSGVPKWATGFGGLGDDSVLDIDVDASGDIAITGTFKETISVGTLELKSAGEADAFVAKLSPEGVPRWAKRYGTKTEDVGSTIASDKYGNVYASGWFRSSVDFGGGPLTSTGEKDVYVVKLDRDGNHRWSKGFGGKQSDYIRSVAVGTDDEPVMVGTFYLTASFGGKPLVADSTGQRVPAGDVVVVKLSP